MVDKGIAGEDTVTCFIAALDCLLEFVDIPYSVYALYTEAYRQQLRDGPDNRHTRRVIRRTLEETTGSSSLKNFHTKRITSVEELDLVIKNANQGSKKIIIWTDPTHVVGVKRLPDERYLMVGNSLPCEDELTIEELFSYLYIPPRSEKKDGHSNLYLVS